MPSSMRVLLLGLILLLLSCGRPATPAVEIHAAASLASVMPGLRKGFERETGMPVRVQLDGSNRLARQIVRGVAADLFISADRGWVDYLAAQGMLEGEPVAIASGRLVIAIHRQGQRIEGPAQLREVGKIATATAGVPLGRYARQALRALGLERTVGERLVSARNARDALNLVASGKVPVGILYAADALAEPRVEVVFTFDARTHQPIEYLAVRLKGSRAETVAAVRYLRSPAAGRLLTQAGFGPPLARGTSATAPPPPTLSIASPLWLSLQVALASLLLSLGPGILLGWLLARAEFRGKLLVVSLVYLPLVLPPVVTGLALLELLGPGGPLGRLGAAFSFAGAVLAAAVVGFPLLVHAVRLSIEAVDPRYETLARSLGAGRWQTFLRVTLPLAWPGVVAGALLTTIRALGEFGATIVLAGNQAGRTQTLSLAIYELLGQPGGERSAFLLSTLAALIALCALALYEWLSRRQKLLLAR